MQVYRYRFPQEPCEQARVKYEDVIVDKQYNRTIIKVEPARPPHNSDYNTTHRLLIHATRVNCDMKLMTDPSTMTKYTTKYVTKVEP